MNRQLGQQGARPYFIYSGRQLTNCYMPLGGIGAGNVSLTGHGKLVRWELFNVINNEYEVPHLFAVACRDQEGRTTARVLNSRPSGHLLQQDVGHGGMGLFPHVRETAFRGTYPLAGIEYRDPSLPVEVALEAFSPFIPHNSEDSGLPAVLFNFTLHNPTRRPLTGTLLSLCCNPVGNGGLAHPRASMAVNRTVRTRDYAGLRFAAEGIPAGDLANGAMMWLSLGSPVTTVPYLEWMDLDDFWRHFEQTAGLEAYPRRMYARERRKPGYGWFGALGTPFRLRAGERRTLTLALCWHFPNLRGALRCSREQEEGTLLGRAYGRRFRGVDEVAGYVSRHRSRLERATRLFRDTLFASTLPDGALDAVSANMAILASTTVMRGADGRIYAFEGSSRDSGSCPMNCTHVWNYEQTLAHLFPDLERTMREADFTVQQYPDGRIEDRYYQPPVCDRRRPVSHESLDGHLGCILKLYREHLRDSDARFLRRHYPAMLRAMDHAVRKYDPKETGVPHGRQYTTFDCAFWGPNTFIGSYYLAALRAVEESARRMGDEARAAWAHKLYLKGRKLQEAKLFNGEYFVQGRQPGRPDDLSIRDYTGGCLTDQLLGQWWADLLNLGDLYAPGKVTAALRAILRHNRRRPLRGHASYDRTFADADENGIIVCTWPRGGARHWPLAYRGECWPGSEYTVAALLVGRGRREGFGIAEDVRRRHRGERRSPWNERECGEFYARSLSSWSLLTAASGFHLDAPRGLLRLAPRLAEPDFGCLVTGAEGWGFFRQRRMGDLLTACLDWRYGELKLSTFELGCLPWSPARVRVRLDGRAAPVTWRAHDHGRALDVVFDAAVRLTAGARLDLAVKRSR
ncbi:MAG: GH116 family glycosyl-hydrolase [Kiritimatiellae bacterium]|nr:GH116 family glycosyl-hydrolase [Kiritimatiellia bacterium]